MFSNIGGKIKALATGICILGMITSVVSAIVLWAQNTRYNDTIVSGIGVLVGGCFASWVGSFFMYGFGQLIEDTALIRGALLPQKKEPAQEPVQAEATATFIRKPMSDLSGWNCPQCRFFNSNARSECAYCGKGKPAPAPRSDALASSAAMSSWAGWTCAHCKFYNTSNPDKCTYCGKEK